MSRTSVLAYSAAAALAVSLSAAPASAQGLGDWDWAWEIYGWLPEIEATTRGGSDIDISIDEILENLDFTFQTNLSASKEDWTLFADAVYLDLGASDSVGTSRPIGGFGRVGIKVDADIDMTAFLSTFGVGYKVYETEKTTLNALGGLRYTYMDVELDADVAGSVEAGLIGPGFEAEFKRQLDVDENAHIFDGVVGLQGVTQLNDRWDLLYYADVGTGDSDITWQASLGVMYSFEKFDLTLRYRYLTYELDGGPLDELTVSGPQIGIRFQF